MRTPSVKRLEECFPGQGERAKAILLMGRVELEALSGQTYYNPPKRWQLKMEILNRLGEFHGVETMALGDGSFVDYLNAGDPYVATLYRWRGNYYVGDWGTLVERHGSMDLQDAIARNGYAQH